MLGVRSCDVHPTLVPQARQPTGRAFSHAWANPTTDWLWMSLVIQFEHMGILNSLTRSQYAQRKIYFTKSLPGTVAKSGCRLRCREERRGRQIKHPSLVLQELPTFLILLPHVEEWMLSTSPHHLLALQKISFDDDLQRLVVDLNLEC